MERYVQSLCKSAGQLVCITSTLPRDADYHPAQEAPFGFIKGLRRFYFGVDGKHMQEVYPGYVAEGAPLNIMLREFDGQRLDRSSTSNETEWFDPCYFDAFETPAGIRITQREEPLKAPLVLLSSLVVPGVAPEKLLRRITYRLTFGEHYENFFKDVDTRPATVRAAVLARGYTCDLSQVEAAIAWADNLARVLAASTKVEANPPRHSWFGRLRTNH